MVSKSMLPALLQKQLFSSPEPETLYTFHNASWQCTQRASPGPSASTLTSLRLITWNIDFMAHYPRERMASALQHLEQLIADVPPSSAIVVFFQEMVESAGDEPGDAKDLSEIMNAPWVREKFNVTGFDESRWNSQYGLVILADRRLDVVSASRLRFVSEYQRHALWVDIQLSSEGGKLLRLCNVHLDSSYGVMRPIQWKALAKHLQQVNAGIAASIVAGDCNATQPRDRTEPRDNGFRDAYLELCGQEDDEKGATWGFQSVDCKRWGRKRLDKQVFWGNLDVTSLWKVGVGVEVVGEAARQGLAEVGELPFVTDHYGLMGTFDIFGGMKAIKPR